MSGIAKAGIGCLVLLIVFFVAVSILGAKFFSSIKDFAIESQKAPVAAAAKLATKLNPNIEVVSTDEATKEITIKDKSSGRTVTMSLDDLQHGQMKIKDAEGTTTLGSEGASHLPSWVPSYPGITATPGGMSTDKDGKSAGMAMAESKDDIAKLREFYTTKLKEAGFKLDSNVDGADSAVITASKADVKQTISVALSKSGEKTSVIITYEGPKS